MVFILKIDETNLENCDSFIESKIKEELGNINISQTDSLQFLDVEIMRIV